MTSAISRAVESFARELPPQGSVLDVGCGLQPYKPLFQHGVYLGIDVDSSGRKAGEKVADVFFDGVHIPLPSDSQDAVLCTEVLEHATEPEALVAEMFRVLRPGGRLCITVPFIWGLHELPYDFRRFTQPGLARLVEAAGFAIQKQEKLVEGAAAIRMLIDSELNHYRVNVRPKAGVVGEGWKFRIAVWVHEWCMRLLMRLWCSQFRFERIYVDNHLLAIKPLEPMGGAAA